MVKGLAVRVSLYEITLIASCSCYIEFFLTAQVKTLDLCNPSRMTVARAYYT